MDTIEWGSTQLRTDSFDWAKAQQQYADAVTLETVAYIKACPQIRAIFAGHLHCDAEFMLTDTLPQYITNMTTARVIRIR